MPLTKQQVQENIDSLKKQGAPHDVIQRYLNTLKRDEGSGLYYKPTENNAYQKASRTSQGLPLGTGTRVAPTFGGEIVRGIAKPFARLTTNLVNFGQELTGNPVTEPFSGSYLGKVKAVGQEGTFSQKVLDAIGVGAEVASNVIGGAGAGSVIKQGAKGAFKQALRTGFRQGAITGGTSSLGSDLQDKNVNAGNTILNTIEGAIGGATIGTIFAGIDNGIIKQLASRSSFLPNVKNQILNKEALEVTSLPANLIPKAQRQAAIKEAGVSKKGLLRLSKINPTKHDLEVAEAATGIVRSGKSLDLNQRALEGVITHLDEGITNEIKSKNIIFNEAQLRSQLNKAKEQSRIIFGSDKTLENRYNDIIEEFISRVKNKNIQGVFEARKEFDSIVRQKFPRTFDGNPSDNVIKNAILDVRRAANDYIAESLPAGNKYREVLKRESLLLEARDNIVDKIEAQLGTNPVIRYFKTPGGGLAKLVVGGAIGAGAALGVGKAVRAAE